MKKTLSIDFDGVLHDYRDGWTGYEPKGEPIPGALEFVQRVTNEGHEVIVSSCRAYTQIGRIGIQEWLQRHGFPRLDVTCEKPHATWYLDDRSIRFEGCFETAWAMMDKEPWFVSGSEPVFEKAA